MSGLVAINQLLWSEQLIEKIILNLPRTWDKLAASLVNKKWNQIYKDIWSKKEKAALDRARDHIKKLVPLEYNGLIDACPTVIKVYLCWLDILGLDQCYKQTDEWLQVKKMGNFTVNLSKSHFFLLNNLEALVERYNYGPAFAYAARFYDSTIFDSGLEFIKKMQEILIKKMGIFSALKLIVEWHRNVADCKPLLLNSLDAAQLVAKSYGPILDPKPLLAHYAVFISLLIKLPVSEYKENRTVIIRTLLILKTSPIPLDKATVILLMEALMKLAPKIEHFKENLINTLFKLIPAEFVFSPHMINQYGAELLKLSPFITQDDVDTESESDGETIGIESSKARNQRFFTEVRQKVFTEEQLVTLFSAIEEIPYPQIQKASLDAFLSCAYNHSINVECFWPVLYRIEKRFGYEDRATKELIHFLLESPETFEAEIKKRIARWELLFPALVNLSQTNSDWLKKLRLSHLVINALKD